MPKDLTPAEVAIEAFGGQSKLARVVGVTRSAVLLWKRTGFIPARRQPLVLKAAREQGLILSSDDLIYGRQAED